MGVPGNFVSLTHIAMTRVLPTVNRFLGGWKEKANNIPDPELRRQALMSFEAKTFHCEGGGIYTLLAGEHARETMRFIIAYQTISDYLDNLCDRGAPRAIRRSSGPCTRPWAVAVSHAIAQRRELARPLFRLAALVLQPILVSALDPGRVTAGQGR